MVEVRVGTLNAYKGSRKTYPLLKRFAEEENLDVLGIQEANGWHSFKFEDFIGVGGLDYAVFGNTRTPFKLVTYSRRSIRRSQVHTSAFWHGAIESTIQINGRLLRHWNTHFDPFNEDKRLSEAAFIVERAVKRIRHAQQARDTIVCGDLNSPAEDGYSQLLAQRLPPDRVARYFDDQGNLRHDATDYLKEHGFIDAAAQVGILENTFPARTDTEPHPQAMRLDYMFVSRDLGDSILKVEVVKNDLTAAISDHFPVITTMNISAPAHLSHQHLESAPILQAA